MGSSSSGTGGRGRVRGESQLGRGRVRVHCVFSSRRPLLIRTSYTARLLPLAADQTFDDSSNTPQLLS